MSLLAFKQIHLGHRGILFHGTNLHSFQVSQLSPSRQQDTADILVRTRFWTKTDIANIFHL